MRILALCGSLREKSTNLSLLKAAAKLAPLDLVFSFYDGLGQLPHFNPDLDSETPPALVSQFRKAIKESDALVVSSPEYAHGVPGALKDALDWIVSSGELLEKPVLLLNAASEGGQRVQAQWAEILRVMGAKVVESPPLFVGAARKAVDDEGNLSEPQLTAAIQAGLESLRASIQKF